MKKEIIFMENTEIMFWKENNMSRRAIFISCFDSYDNRIKSFVELFEQKGYEIKYLYADFQHVSKCYNSNIYKDGKRIKVIPYRKNLSVKRLYSHYLFSKQVIKYIEKVHPDFIYCMIPPNSLVKKIGMYKQIHTETKLIFDIYDRWPESFPYLQYSRLFRLPFAYWGNLRKNYVGQADIIFCVSEEVKKGLIAEARDKPINVVRPVVPEGEMPEYKPRRSVLSFVYLGMINHIVDMDLVESILGALAEKRRTILHIIGEGQYLNEFVTRIENVGVEVVCHGCIFEQKKKNLIFSLCNMGLNIPRKEIDSTMSLKAIEYLRVGLPFVNNANGEIRRIVEEDKIGVNVEDNNIDKIVDWILGLHKQDYMKIHNNCINSYKNRFLAQNYDDIFDGLLR